MVILIFAIVAQPYSSTILAAVSQIHSRQDNQLLRHTMISLVSPVQIFIKCLLIPIQSPKSISSGWLVTKFLVCVSVTVCVCERFSVSTC